MAPSQYYLVLFVVVAIVCQSLYSDACFITNCPPGGKRSIFQKNNFRQECSRCGIGRCYGPSICCSSLFGCIVGGPMARSCAMEATNPHLCVNPGRVCGPEGKGVCALKSTCCTPDGCFSDKACLTSASDDAMLESEISF